MLEIKNLYAGYDAGRVSAQSILPIGKRPAGVHNNGVDVIKNINLEAKAGEILCIAGPNGCGKSTLLKTIARLLPYRGSITVDGQDTVAFTRKDLSKKIALLGQSSQIYFPYTVYDTISLGRYVHTSGFLKNLSAEDRNIIAAVIERLELEDVQNQLITALSGGQLQRVFLARTLVQDPEIILLDEPTNHLDLKHQIELLQYLSVWAKEKNRIIVGVLHDLNLVHRFSDYAALMSNGELVSCGKPEEILNGAILREVYGMDIGAFMRESLERWK